MGDFSSAAPVGPKVSPASIFLTNFSRLLSRLEFSLPQVPTFDARQRAAFLKAVNTSRNQFQIILQSQQPANKRKSRARLALSGNSSSSDDSSSSLDFPVFSSFTLNHLAQRLTRLSDLADSMQAEMKCQAIQSHLPISETIENPEKSKRSNALPLRGETKFLHRANEAGGSSALAEENLPAPQIAPSPSLFSHPEARSLDKIREEFFHRVRTASLERQNVSNQQKKALATRENPAPPGKSGGEDFLLENDPNSITAISELSDLTAQLKEAAVELRSSLQKDSRVLDSTALAMENNLTGIQKENQRLSKWARSSCTETCLLIALVAGLFVIFFSMIVFMKIVPAPK